MDMYRSTISEIMDAISVLQDSLRRLRNEVINLPPSDFREKLLSYVDKHMFWETADDLTAMRERLLSLISTQDTEIKKTLTDVCMAISKVLCICMES